MTTPLNKIELDITKEIVNIGLSKSADSLSFFIREKVLIQLIDIKINAEDYAPVSRKNNIKKSYLLTTEIKGEITGKAYLILNEEEVEKIVSSNLPESIKNNPDQKKMMSEAFLLEIDNIITASVITQFSNILNYKIYGDVPSLDIIDSDKLNDFLTEKNSDTDLNKIYFNSRFLTENMDINPEFIWLMSDKFFEGVKNTVSDEKKIELMNKINIGR